MRIFRALHSKLWASCQTKEQSRRQAHLEDRFLSFRTAQRNKIGKQPISTRDPGRQLPKPRVASVNDVTFTGVRDQQPTVHWFFAGIIGRENGSPPRVPLVGKIQSALLNPSFEIFSGDLVRRIQDRMIRRENSDLRSFISYAIARDFEWICTDILGLEVGRSVVLRNDHTTSLDIVQQLRLQIGNSILRVVSANTEHNGIESGKIFRRHISGLQHFDGVADLLKTLGNLISRTGKIANLLPRFPNVGPDHPGFGRRHQYMDADVWISDLLATE